MATSALDFRDEGPSTEYLAEKDLPVTFGDSQGQEAWMEAPADPGANDESDSREVDAFREAPSGGRAKLFRFPEPIPRLPDPAYHFDLRQQWEGTVLGVGKEEFRARLADLTNSETPPEEATFSTDEIFPGDRDRLVPGAVFRWSIGYRTQGSQRERVSRIHFARLPGWSKRAVESVEAEAAELHRIFRDPHSST